MANVIDNLGRSVDTATMELKEIRGLVASLMKGKTGPAKPYAPTPAGPDAAGQTANLETDEANKRLKELAASLQATANASVTNKSAVDKIASTLGETLQSMASAAQGYVESVKAYTDEIKTAKESLASSNQTGGAIAEPTASLAAVAANGPDKPTKEEKISGNYLKDIAKGEKKSQEAYKNLNKLSLKGLKKGSIYTHDERVVQLLEQILENLSGGKSPAGTAGTTGAGAGGPGSPGGGRRASSSGDGGGKKQPFSSEFASGKIGIRNPDLDDLQAMQNIIYTVHGYTLKLEKAFLGFNAATDENVGLLTGLVGKERDFIKEVRAAAYETAGVTGETRNLQKAYEAIGKTAQATGQNRTETQKTYIAALKKGIKDEKLALNISTAQLNTATMLGLKAEDMGETFVDWHNQFRMNLGQLNEMNRGMRDIARYTGLTGKNMAEAMKSSEEFVKQLRNAATLTASTAKNVMEITAQAQKLGIAEQMNPLMKAMASSTSFIVDASAETRSLLVYAASQTGRIGDLMNGTVLQSKEGIKDMAKGLQGVLKRFGVNSLEEIDQLGNEAKRNINLQLKAAFGLELGELRSTIEAMNEAGKTTSDRLADIQRKRKQENLTIEETKGLLEEERRLKTSAALSMMTALDEAAKGAGSMEQALAKFGSRRGDFESDLNALGHSWTSNADAARAAIQDAVSNVNAGLKDVGKGEMTIDASRIEAALKDPVAFRELSAEISKAEQEFAVAQKAQLDPMSKMEQYLREINDTLRNVSSGFMSGLMNVAGGLFPLVAIAALAGQAVTGILSMAAQLKGFDRSLQTLRGNTGDDGSSGIINKAMSALGLGKKDNSNPDSTIVTTDTATSAATAAATTDTNALDAHTKIFTDMRSILRAIAKCVCAKGQTKEQISEQNIEVPKVQTTGIDAVTPPTTAPTPTTPAPPTTTTSKTNTAVGAVAEIDTDALQGILKEHGKIFADMRSILREMVKHVAAGRSCVCDAEMSAAKGAAAEAPKAPKTSQAKPKAAEAGTPAPTGATATPTPPADLSGGAPAGIGDQMLEKAKAAAGEAKGLIKAAAIMGGIAVAVVALAAVLTMITSKILKATKVDIGTAMMTAMNVAGIIGAAAAIAAGVVGAIKGLEALNAFIKETDSIVGTLTKGAFALFTLTPAVLGIALGVILMSQGLSAMTGVSWDSALATAGTVAAILVAAGAIAAGVTQVIEPMEDLKKFVEGINIGDMVKMLFKGGAALLILAPALTFLAAGVTFLTGGVMSMMGMDAGTAAKTAAGVGALILSAALIAGAVIGAMAGLYGLGLMANWLMADPTAMWAIASGALAFFILAPAVTLLAAGVAAMIGGMMGALGIDAGAAAKVAWDVGVLILSAAAIAGGVIGAMAGLYGLALLLPFAGAHYGAILGGTAALLLLTPALIGLASAVVFIAQGAMSAMNVDPAVAAETAKAVAVVIGSAAAIALGVAAAVGGLALLGMAIPLILSNIWIILGGAAALFVLTPAVLALSNAIINMASSLMSGGVDPSAAAATAQALSDVLSAATDIAFAILAQVAILGIFGAMTLVAWVLVPLMFLGIAAIKALTPPIVGFAIAVTEMANAVIGSMPPGAATEAADGLRAILDAAGDIASMLLGMVPTIAKFAIFGMPIIGSFLIWGLEKGTEGLLALSEPIIGFIGAVVGIAKSLGTSLNPSQAAEMADGVAKVLESAGAVASRIEEAIPGIQKMAAYNNVWLFGNPVIGLLWLGISGLQNLKDPIVGYINTITDIARAVGNSLDPSQAAEMAKGVADVLAGAGAVADEIEAAMPRIMSMGWYVGGWWNPITWGLWLGIAGLQSLKLPMIAYIDTITDIAKSVGKSLNPSKAAEMAEGVANVLAASGAVADEIRAAVPKVMGLGWFALGWIGSFLIKMLNLGVDGLKALKGPIVAYVGAIHDISKEIGSKVKPSQAAEMAQGVADVLEASANVAEKIQKASSRLFWIGLMAAWAGTSTKYLWKGIGALKVLEDPVVAFVVQTVAFAKRIGQVVNPAFAKEITEGVGAIMDMSLAVSDLVEETASRVAVLGFMGFFGDWISKSMTKGVEVFKKMKAPVIDFLKATKTAALEMAAVINPSDAKSVMMSLQRIAMIVQQVGKVFDVVYDSIVPMTQGSFFTRSPLEQMRRAQYDLEAFFPVLVDFVNDGIVDSVNSGMKDIDKLRSAAKNLTIMSLILKAVGPSMDIMMDSIVPLTQGSFWKSSPLKQMKSAIPQFADLFEQTAEFVKTGIVDPIQTHLSDSKGLKTAGRTIQTMALVLDAVRTSIDSMASVAAIYSDGGFFTNSTATEISAGLQDDKLPTMIGDIADFVNNSIIGPIERNFTNPKELEKTGKTMKILACVMCATKTMLTKLVDVVALMEPESFWKDAPIEKVMASKDDFADYFYAIAIFMKEGILEPVDKVFPDPSEIRKAGTTITILTGVATSLPPLIKGLAQATGMAIRGESFFSNAPMKDIVNAKDTFSEYFKSIAEFMRDGIVEPTLTVFTDTSRVSAARTIIEALTAISASIPPLIGNLSEAMGLLLDEGLMKSAPMKEIHKWKLVWAWYWESILDFMRDGIIIPIINELENKLGVKKIVEAARILRAVASIISQVPPIIKDLAFKLMPLLEGEGLDEAPMELIKARTDDFTKQFTAIAAFIRDGIVWPILSEIPEAKTITEAARILRSVSSVLSQLPEIFRNLGKVFGPLDPTECFSESPIEMLVSNIPTYKAQMIAFARFMREGIIEPIFTHFPNPEEVTAVAGMLRNMITVVRMLPTFLTELSTVMSGLTFTMFGLIKSPAARAYGSVKTFALYFAGIATFLGEGIVKPILTGFPSAKGVEDAYDRLKGMLRLLRMLPSWLTALNEEMVKLTTASWVHEDLSSSVPAFTNYFHSIAMAIGEGIVRPVRDTFASTEELPEIIARMEGVKDIIRKASEMMEVLGEELGPWVEPNKSFLFFSWGSKMADTGDIADRFRSQFTGVARAITHGILEPVKSFFPPLAEVEATLATVEGIIGIFKGLDEMMTALAEVINNMDTTGIDFEKLNKIDWQGIGTGLSNVPNTVPAMPAMPSALAPSAPSALTGARSGALPSALAPAAPSALTGARSGSSLPSALESMASKESQKALTREERLAKWRMDIQRKESAVMGGRPAGGLSEAVQATRTTVSEKVINQSTQKKEALASESLSMNMNEFARQSLTVPGIFTQDLLLANLLTKMMEGSEDFNRYMVAANEQQLNVEKAQAMHFAGEDIQWEDPAEQAEGFFKSVMGEKGLIGSLGGTMGGLFGGLKSALGGMFGGLEKKLTAPPKESAPKESTSAMDKFQKGLEEATSRGGRTGRKEFLTNSLGQENYNKYRNNEMTQDELKRIVNQKFGQGDDSASGEVMTKFAEQGMEPGSIYTHDIHVEKLLNQLMAGKGAGQKVGTDVALHESLTPQAYYNQTFDEKMWKRVNPKIANATKKENLSITGQAEMAPYARPALSKKGGQKVGTDVTLHESLTKTGGPQAYYNQNFDEKMWKRVNPKIANATKKENLSITGQAEMAPYARPALSKKGIASGVGSLTPSNMSEVIEREHGAGAEGKHVPPANMAGDAGIAGMTKKFGLNAALGGVNRAATSNEYILTHKKLGMEANTSLLADNIQAMTAGFTAGPNPFVDQPVVERQAAEVQTANPVDVHSRVHQDNVSAEAGVATLTSPELSRVASATDAQISLQSQMVSHLSKISEYLKPSTKGDSSTNPGGSTATNYVTHRPAKYFKWTTGQHHQLGCKDIGNISNPAS